MECYKMIQEYEHEWGLFKKWHLARFGFIVCTQVPIFVLDKHT